MVQNRFHVKFLVQILTRLFFLGGFWRCFESTVDNHNHDCEHEQSDEAGCEYVHCPPLGVGAEGLARHLSHGAGHLGQSNEHCYQGHEEDACSQEPMNWQEGALDSVRQQKHPN